MSGPGGTHQEWGYTAPACSKTVPATNSPWTHWELWPTTPPTISFPPTPVISRDDEIVELLKEIRDALKNTGGQPPRKTGVEL